MGMSNHIEEYFKENKETSQERASREIFRADNDTDIKTELNIKEIPLINTMVLNDNVLKSVGLKPSFSLFYNSYFRLKISLDRKSRGEFVNINKTNNTDDVLTGINTAGNLFNRGSM